MLRDTIISGLTSDKIRAKIVKEGHGVNLNRVMEVARLEVSTQQQFGEDARDLKMVNYVQYGKSTQAPRRGRNHSLVQGQVAQGQAATGDPGPVENSTKDLLYHQTPATDVGKEDTKRHRTAKLWMQHAEDVVRKGTFMRKRCLKGKTFYTLWKFPQASCSAGQGLVNPFTSVMRDNQCTLMVSVPPCEQTFNQISYCIGTFNPEEQQE